MVRPGGPACRRTPVSAWRSCQAPETPERRQRALGLCTLVCLLDLYRSERLLTLRPGAINDEMRQSGPPTGDGLRFATFYTNLHDRLLRPLLAADKTTRTATTAKRIAHY